MSAHGDPAPTDPHADHAHGDLGVPSDELEPGEPHTPMWLPLLGGALLLFVILLFVATRPAGKTTSELSEQATPSASAADSAEQPVPAPPAPGQPAQPGAQPAPQPPPPPGMAPGPR